VILARVNFPTYCSGWRDSSGSRFYWELAALKGVWVGWGVSEVLGSFVARLATGCGNHDDPALQHGSFSDFSERCAPRLKAIELNFGTLVGDRHTKHHSKFVPAAVVWSVHAENSICLQELF
jgi:hypothetical protein